MANRLDRWTRIPLGLSLLVACSGDGGFENIPNDLPELAITSHQSGDVVLEHQPFTVSGTVADKNDQLEVIEIRWRANDQVVCGPMGVDSDGTTSCRFDLALDDNPVITLSAVDDDDGTAQVSVTLVVDASTPPTVQIRSPVAGSRWYANTPVPLDAIVADPDQLAPELNLAWASDVDGPLLEDRRADQDGVIREDLFLSQGNHLITLTATDDAARSGSDSVAVVVGPPNVAPLCELDNTPILHPIGTAGSVRATLSDANVPATELTVEWSSDRVGALQTTNPDSTGLSQLALDNLPRGVHTLRVRATDDAGASCEATTQVRVGSAPELTVTSPVAGATGGDNRPTSLGLAITDPDGETTFDVSWTSDRDGVIVPASTVGSPVTHDVSLSGGAHVLTAQAVDPWGFTGMAQVRVTIDRAPSGPLVAIEPELPSGGQALDARLVQPSVDPDGTAVTYAWAWTADGVAVADLFGPTVPAGRTARGQRWRVSVLSTDGLSTSLPAADEVVIQNGAPSASGVAITPAPASPSTPLRCGYLFSDPDGDVDHSTVAWTVDGVAAGAGASFAGAGVGAAVRCVVTPSDGTLAGSPAFAEVVIADDPAASWGPTLTGVHISPDAPTSDDALWCEAIGFSDPEGGPDGTTYAWSVNGVGAGSTAALSGVFGRGDVVTCTATPRSEDRTGAPTATTVVIRNTPPIVSSVAITPADPAPGQALTCGWTWTDADGDPDGSRVVWAIDGGYAGSGAVLAGGAPAGSTVSCEVLPDDGADLGIPIHVTTEVRGAAPSIDGVTISPASPTAESALTCAWNGFVGAVDLSTRAWTVNGAPAGSAAILAVDVARGDLVGCEVTPFDGLSTGVPRSATATILNAPPRVADVEISPEEPTTADVLTCTWSFADADGDMDASQVAWTIDGAFAGTGVTLYGDLPADAEVRCTVVPDDGVDLGVPMSTTVSPIAAAPRIASVAVLPEAPDTDDVLTCTWGGFTPGPGLTDQSIATWTINGQPAGTGAHLAVDADRGDVVACSVTPFDGVASGDSVQDAVTVANALPSAPAATLDPTAPIARYDDIVCRLASPPTDADGDALTVVYSWTRNGQPYTGSRDATVRDGDTIPADALAPGEVWSCTISVSDGLGWSVGAAAQVTVEDPADTCSGFALSFDGVNDVVQVPRSAVSVSAVQTVEFWMRWDEGEVSDLIHAYTNLGGVQFGIDSDGKIYLPSVGCQSDLALAPGKWTHIAASNQSLYIDGQEVADMCATSLGQGLLTVNVNNGLTFRGAIDEIRVSTVVRYNAEFAPATQLNDDPFTAALFHFDEGVGDVVSAEGTANLAGIRLGATWLPDGVCDVALGNIGPGRTLPGILPEFARAGVDRIVCTTQIPAVDVDGDSLSYVTIWYEDGVPWTGATATTTHAGDTLPADVLQAGSWYGCTLQAYDGQTFGPVSAFVERLAADRTPIYTPGGSYVDGAGFAHPAYSRFYFELTGTFQAFAHAYSGGALCGLRDDGSVTCVGPNTPEIDERIESDVPAGSFVAVAMDADDACAIDQTGFLHCWGSDPLLWEDAPTYAVSAVSINDGIGCAIRASDGQLACWNRYSNAPWMAGVAGPFDDVEIVLPGWLICAHRVGGGWECLSADESPSPSQQSTYDRVHANAARDPMEAHFQPSLGGYCTTSTDGSQHCESLIGGAEFGYDPTTGVGLWLATPTRFVFGQVCGLDTDYRLICVNGSPVNTDGPDNYHERRSDVPGAP